MSNPKVFSHFSANSIQLQPFPFRSELAMEAYLYENSDVLKLYDNDSVQVHSLEKPWYRGSKLGRIDLSVSYNNDYYAIVELKNAELVRGHFKQLEEYFEKEAYKANVVSEDKELVPYFQNIQ
ncbi:MAG: hypothetical protein FWH35_00055 [Treponema sp.]|nr:hypothetical protein [Treponema sp.]